MGLQNLFKLNRDERFSWEFCRLWTKDDEKVIGKTDGGIRRRLQAHLQTAFTPSRLVERRRAMRLASRRPGMAMDPLVWSDEERKRRDPVMGSRKQIASIREKTL